MELAFDLPFARAQLVRRTVQEWKKTSPVRVRCSCGSRIWVSLLSSNWLLSSFLDRHCSHEYIELEQKGRKAKQ